MLYQQIQHYLQSPRRIILDPSKRECDPPEDPDWPTPINEREILELMRRLPHWAQVVCAVTAAEMVLWLWEDWVIEVSDQIETTYQDQAPHQAIKTTRQWLNGDASADEADAAARAAWDAGADALTESAGGADVAAARAAWVARAASRAAWSASGPTRAAGARNPTRAAGAATGAARDAAWAAGVWGAGAIAGAAEDAAFFRDWWDLCRCRLAFAHPLRQTRLRF